MLRHRCLFVSFVVRDGACFPSQETDGVSIQVAGLRKPDLERAFLRGRTPTMRPPEIGKMGSVGRRWNRLIVMDVPPEVSGGVIYGRPGVSCCAVGYG